MPFLFSSLLEYIVEPAMYFCEFGFFGMATNSILFCWLFTIKDHCKKLCFLRTHNHQLFLTESWDLSTLVRHAWQGWSLYLSNMQGEVEFPWRAPWHLKKPSRSKTMTKELMEGTKQQCPMRVRDLPSTQVKDFFYKKRTGKKWVSGETCLALGRSFRYRTRTLA